MILWTILPKEAETVMEKGYFYKNLNMIEAGDAYAIQLADVVELPTGDTVHTYPIQCFSHIASSVDSFFGIPMLVHKGFSELGFGREDIENYRLFELWVEEEDIFESYVKLGSDCFNDEKEIVLPDFAHTKLNHGEFARHRGDVNVYALLQVLRKEMVLSISKIERIKTCCRKTYVVKPEVFQSYPCPTFTTDIIVCSDGKPRCFDGQGRVIPRKDGYLRGLQMAFGMRQAYDYMTVEEALNCCCGFATQEIFMDAIKTETGPADWSKVTILDMKTRDAQK